MKVIIIIVSCLIAIVLLAPLFRQPVRQFNRFYKNQTKALWCDIKGGTPIWMSYDFSSCKFK